MDTYAPRGRPFPRTIKQGNKHYPYRNAEAGETPNLGESHSI
jgi:hypothetical protein